MILWYGQRKKEEVKTRARSSVLARLHQKETEKKQEKTHQHENILPAFVMGSVKCHERI